MRTTPIKIGSKVRIIDARPTKTEFGWAPEMDSLIGQTLTVADIVHGLVYVKESEYILSDKSLEEVA